jgi:hypothetical protein
MSLLLIREEFAELKKERPLYLIPSFNSFLVILPSSYAP